MAKANKTVYVCSDCGSDYAKWQGQCTQCGEWNTLSRLSVDNSPGGARQSAGKGFTGKIEALQSLSEVATENATRLSTELGELDRVLGGGLVPGSAILISGNPGAGKSTLLMQLLCRLSERHRALYVTGEESLSQLALRARRLNLPMDKLKVMSQTNVEEICATAETLLPELMVVDSIQTMYVDRVDSSPGGVSQVRESAASLLQYAKKNNIVLLLVGHVTKDGSLAGPRVLEHMIDCFITLEGDSDSRYRTLRSVKNRFGAVNELGIFAMTDKGMVEVSNPSAIFLSRGEETAPGSTVMAIWEGSRTLLLEVQALVDQSSLGNPRRLAVGFDQNRLAMLIAILHRHAGLQLGDQDVFVNAVGGMRVIETSSDLALLLAMVSSFRNRALDKRMVCFGEVGLSGEIRPVPNGQERLREAAKHGFTRAIVPKANLPRQEISGMKIKGVTKLAEAIEAIQ